MKRLVCILMVLTLCFGLLVGCGGDNKVSGGSSNGGGSNGGGSTASKVEVTISTEKINYLAADGTSTYRIVRPDGNSAMSTIAALVFKSLKETIGTSVRSILDSAEDGTDVYEILVGQTSRPESQMALDYLYSQGHGKYDDYIICTIGKKIVINGFTDAKIEEACEYFVENFIKKEGIEGGIKYIVSTPGQFATMTINGVDIYKFQVIRDKSSRSWLIQDEYRKVQDYIKETSGYLLPLKEDKDVAEAEYEIHIGNTNRTAKPASGYSVEEWEIAISDKKVYIAGGSEYAVQVAVTEFGKLLEKNNITNADSKTGIYSQTVAGYDSGSYYSLKYTEDFNDPSALTFDSKGLASLKDWHLDALETNNRVASDGNSFYGNAYLANDRDTIAIRDGNLIQRAILMEDSNYSYTEGGGSAGHKYKHASGIWKYDFEYYMGYIEMRARIPDGKGVWSSFWVYDTDDKFEIDIFETLGFAHTLRPTIHIWYPEYNDLDGTTPHEQRSYVLDKGTLFDEYHTIGMLWDYSGIKFFCDGELYFDYDISIYNSESEANIDNHWMKIIAGFNVGWYQRTQPDDNVKFPLEYHIDYIRLYQVDGQMIKYSK